MTNASSADNQSFPRFNLRILQTDTERRFILLSFAIFSTSLYIFRTELVTLFLNPSLSSCIAQSFRSPGALTVYGLNFSCAWQPDVFLLVGLLLGELLLLGVAFLIYWFFPSWKCWREQLNPLKEDEWPGVSAYLDKLPEAYRRSFRLRYVCNWSPSKSPLVFGRWGRYYLFLPYGFLAFFKDDRDRFDAVILHELSHLYNKREFDTVGEPFVLARNDGIVLNGISASEVRQRYILTAIFRPQDLCGYAEWCAVGRMMFRTRCCWRIDFPSSKGHGL